MARLISLRPLRVQRHACQCELSTSDAQVSRACLEAEVLEIGPKSVDQECTVRKARDLSAK
jgi:hypothetical protein